MKHAGLVILAAFAAATLFLGQPLAAWATTDELSALRQKNAELEKKVSELEALLKQCVEAGKNRFSEEHGWQNRRNWRSLEPGMKEEQVRALLGQPVREIKGVKTLWYYPSIYGGYVSFDDKGLLSGWKEP
jgi:outer membrane protein assembly factor BamE (lipoprotein component of BamABCDE complex)